MASPTRPASAPVLSPSEETVTIMPRSKSADSSLGKCTTRATESISGANKEEKTSSSREQS